MSTLLVHPVSTVITPMPRARPGLRPKSRPGTLEVMKTPRRMAVSRFGVLSDPRHGRGQGYAAFQSASHLGLAMTLVGRAWMMAAIGLGMGLLSGCHRAGPAGFAARVVLDQRHVCVVHDWTRTVVAAACTPGEKVAFLPATWGNEQLPIYFVAVNCDLRYSIGLTPGGVSCIDRGR